jgi:hypothetical protein
MSKSHRYNPDDPYGSYARKVNDNNRRRTRQRIQKSRQDVFQDSATQAANNEPYTEEDYYYSPESNPERRYTSSTSSVTRIDSVPGGTDTRVRSVRVS